MTDDPIHLLATRRSVKPDKLVEPAPSAGELEQILTIAARVPDHKKLTPWRFIVFEGAAREKFGATFGCIPGDPGVSRWRSIYLVIKRGLTRFAYLIPEKVFGRRPR